MPQFVAIEFDRHGLRAAVVEEMAGKPVVARLARLEDSGLDTVASLAGALRSALPDVRWSRARVVGVVGGDQLRCRLLKLPPTPDGELPDMVRLQAAREFASSEGEGVVDFVPLTGDASTPRTLLAASLETQDLNKLKELAHAIDAPLDRVVPRGIGASSLALRIDPALGSGSHLIVAPSEEAVDLVAVEDGAPTLLRSTRVPADAPREVLASEARRTAAMAAQQSGRRVDSTVFFTAEHTPDRPGSVFLDVADRLIAEYGLAEEHADDATKMAGVVSAALDRAVEVKPALDFLHPRRPVKDNSEQRRKIVLAASAAACVLLGAAFAYARLWSLDRQVSSAEELLRADEKRVEDLAPYRQRAEAIESWLSTDVNWLDEFERLGRKLRPETLDSKEFPAEQDVYLKQFTATKATQRNTTGGQIALRAVSRNPFSYDEIEQSLRDDRHEVETAIGSAAPGGGKYSWETQTTLRVQPDSREDTP